MPSKDPESEMIKNIAKLIVNKQEGLTLPNLKGEKVHKGSVKDDFFLNFNLRPKELESYLNEFVVGQGHAVRTLATEICTHYNTIKEMKKVGEDPMKVVDQIKPNIMILGPTGSGKTYTLKLIADKLGLPFVKGDATKFSETGYVGGDVEDLVRDLMKGADGDIEKAQYGIVYIDEIDKIAERKLNGHSNHVSRSGVQRGLLKIMEESEVDLTIKLDVTSQVLEFEEFQKTRKRKSQKINTKNILFVLSGAFSELEEQLKEKKKKSSSAIGFGSDIISKDTHVDIKIVEETPQELVEYGFESEFIGRTPIITAFDKLTRDGLVEILNNPNSSVIQKVKRDFKGYGIDISFDVDSMEYFADEAIELGTGARGLVTVIYKALRDYKAELPDTGISSFNVTRKIIENGFDKIGLSKEIGLRAGLKSYISMIETEYFVNISIDPELTEKIYNIAKKSNTTPFKYCSDSFHTLEQELNVIRTFYGDTKPDKKIGSIDLDAEMINDLNLQKQIVADIAKNSACDAYARRIMDEIGVPIEFDDEAKEKIYLGAENASISPFLFCQRALDNMKEGFKLLQREKGVENFTITGSAIDNPDQYIKDLFSTNYHEKQ